MNCFLQPFSNFLAIWCPVENMSEPACPEQAAVPLAETAEGASPEDKRGEARLCQKNQKYQRHDAQPKQIPQS